MGKSNRLPEADIRDVMRLVREVCELGEDAVAWRRHALERLCRMLGARIGLAYVFPLTMSVEQMRVDLVVEVGTDPMWERYRDHGDLTADPTTPRMAAHAGENFTAFRQQLCDDGEWYGSAFFNEVRRPMHLDDTLYSQLMLAGRDQFHGLGFGLEMGMRQPFGPRDAALIALFHEELDHLWSTPPLRPERSRPVLTSRLRQTLRLLARGYSRKQVATELRLSAHTINDYVKELHKRFECSSTGEMLALHRARAFSFRPAVT